MHHECADGAICGIAAVDVKWDELASAVPAFLDDTIVLGAVFVVKHLERDHMVMRLETAHDQVVGLDVVIFLLGLESGVKDGVGVAMIGNHDVLVAAA